MSKCFKFGNSNAIIINDLDTKNKIIDYLFNSIALSKYRYHMLDNVKQLENLKKNPHYVSPNFKGYNYFLIFMKIDNQSYCVAIDRKRLSYHRKNINISNINLYKLKVSASMSVFQGTIFDCKLIRNKLNKYLMLIKDCYKLMGSEDIIEMELNDKMYYLNSIVNNQINSCDNFQIKINKFYNYLELKDLVKNVIPKCKLDIIGLCFYPKFSGISVIFVNKIKEKVEINSNEKIKNESYHMIKNLPEFLKAREYSYEKNGRTKNMFIEKTNITDVYNLYENTQSDDKIGIAHVPNLKISNYLSENTMPYKIVSCNCIFNNIYKKWIPLNLN